MQAPHRKKPRNPSLSRCRSGIRQKPPIASKLLNQKLHRPRIRKIAAPTPTHQHLDPAREFFSNTPIRNRDLPVPLQPFLPPKPPPPSSPPPRTKNCDIKFTHPPNSITSPNFLNHFVSSLPNVERRTMNAERTSPIMRPYASSPSTSVPRPSKPPSHDGRRFLTRTRVPTRPSSTTTAPNSTRKQSCARSSSPPAKTPNPEKPDIHLPSAPSPPPSPSTNKHFPPRLNIITHPGPPLHPRSPRLSSKNSAAYTPQTHRQPPPTPAASPHSSLAWIAAHHPALLKNARIGQLSSLVGHLLTHQLENRPLPGRLPRPLGYQPGPGTNASAKSLEHPRRRPPRGHWAEEPIGTLTEQIAKE